MATVKEKISNFVKSKLSNLMGSTDNPTDVSIKPSFSSRIWESPIGQSLVNLQRVTEPTYTAPKSTTVPQALKTAATDIIRTPVQFGRTMGSNISDLVRYQYGKDFGTLAQQPTFKTQEEYKKDVFNQAKRAGIMGVTIAGAKYPSVVASQTLLSGGLNTLLETPRLISGETKLSELPNKFAIGAIESFPRALAVAGVVGPTQPLMDKITPVITSKVMKAMGTNSALSNQVIQRSSDAVMNILQGIPVNIALEREPVDVQSVIIDGLTGALLSTSANQALKGLPKEEVVKKIQEVVDSKVKPTAEPVVETKTVSRGVRELTKAMKKTGITLGEVNGSKVFKSMDGREMDLTDAQNILGKDLVKYAGNIAPKKESITTLVRDLNNNLGRPSTIEDVSKVTGGWKTPTQKAEFDKAMLLGDAKTVESMLPDVPTQYKTIFSDRINKLLGTDISETGSKMAMGAMAGIEPEYDENGNMVGVKINPTKAALGVAFMGATSNKSFDLKDATDSLKFLDDDTVFKQTLKNTADSINSKNLGDVRLDEQTFDESMIRGIDLEDFSAKSNKNFLGGLKSYYDSVFFPTRNLPEDLQNAHRNFWAKRMATTEVATERAAKFFNIPEEKGWKMINDIESGKRTPETEAIRQEFDKLYKEATDEGLDVGYLDNYVTHIWEQTPEQVKSLSNSLGQKFKFSGERGLPTYAEGLRVNEYAGQQLFTPKYTHPSQILAEYVKKLEDTKANIEYFKFLKEKKYIVPERVGRDLNYQPITASFFPKSRAIMGPDNITVSNWYAPSKLAGVINSQFGSTDTPARQALKFISGISGKTQDITLSGGIGPLNYWTIGNMMKQAYTGIGDILTGHPVRGVKTGFITPMKAFFTAFSEPASVKYFDNNQGTLKEMAEEGITFSRVGDYTDRFTNALKKQSLSEKTGKAWNKFFNEPTFKRFMPIMQVELYKDIKNSLLTKGMDDLQARSLAANTLRNMEGMSNSLAEGRDPAVQDAIGALFFAPRYRESIMNFLNSTRRSIGLTRDPLKYLVDPAYARNRSFVLGTVAMYGMYNALNRKLTGHDMKDNPAGQELHLQIPLKDGDYAFVPLLPSVFYLPRTAIEAASAIYKGDISEAKRKATGLLSQPINLVSQLTNNQDYFGNPIYDEGDDALTKYRKLGGYLIGNLSHPYIREIIAVNQGRKPLYQGIINALELPVKFKTEKSLFWNKYFANKAVAEDFKVLAESDPQKAQEFYNKNKTKIDDFMAQKVTASAYYDAKSSVDALKKSGADPEIIREAEKSMNNVFKPKNGEPTQMIDGNNAGDTYARMYGFDTYLKEVPQDELELKKYASEVLKDARGVYSNKYIPEDLKSGMIEKMGLDPREVEIDVISGKTVVDRALWAREYLAGVPEEQRAKALSDLINYKTLSGKRIMTKDVAKELGLEGAYNSFYIKQSSSGRPGGKVTLRKVSPEKVSEPIEVGKMPEIKPISISEMLSKTPDYTASKSAISESELSKLRKPIKA